MLIAALTLGLGDAIPAQTQSVSVTVDAGKSAGTVPSLFRIGAWPYTWIPSRYIQDKVFLDLKLGTIQIDLGQSLFRRSVDKQDLMARLRFLDPFLRRLNDEGATIILAFSKLPPWISSRPNARQPATSHDSTPVSVLSPPRNYGEWADLVQDVAGHVRDLGITAWYKIGWEPSSYMWQGTQEEFFELYKASVLGIKRADPKAKVGGPAASSFGPHWRKKQSTKPMVEAFIDYAARTSLPELGLKRLPIDFIAHHAFRRYPETSYGVLVKALSGWMARNGYDPDTKIFIGEWAEEPGPASMARESSAVAAFLVASLVGMERAGIDHQTYSSLTEQLQSNETQFTGGLGMFTKDGVIRPSYNAYRALSYLGDTRVPVTSNVPSQIYAVAGKDADRIALVMSNFMPSPRTLMTKFGDLLAMKGHYSWEVNRYLKDRNKQMMQILRGSLDPRRAGVPEQMAADMTRAAAQVRGDEKALKSNKKKPAAVNVTLTGLSWLGDIESSIYLIDSRHGAAINDKTKIDAQIKESRRRARQSVRRDLDGQLKAQGYKDDDIRAFRKFMALSPQNKQSQQRKMPLQQRMILSSMRDSMKGIIGAAMSKDLDQINNDPKVGLKAVERRKYKKSGTLNLTINMEPNSVALIVLEKR